MDLTIYVKDLQEQLMVAAETGGEETRQAAGRLAAALDSATRLVLLDALSTAADEITRELAPGTVEVRLRSGEPEFVVSPPPTEEDFDEIVSGEVARAIADDGDDGGTARLNLRLPETLKQRIETAAGAEGLSLNAWLVRAAGSALDAMGSRRSPTGGDRYTGWVR